jgi:hypothetical protein
MKVSTRKEIAADEYVTDEQLEPAQQALNEQFLTGNCCSQSPTWEVAQHAREALSDHGLPIRKSLVMMMVNKARLNYRAVSMAVQRELDQDG